MPMQSSKAPAKVISVSKQSGFSLIEVIVAIVIFSLIMIACTLSLTRLIDYVERDRNIYQDQNRIQRTWNIVLQDMLHLLPRTQRDRLGGVARAYQTDFEDYQLIFTRGGLPSINGSIGGLQRVAYSVDEDGQFVRWTWPGLDLYDDQEPSGQVLMGGVAKLEFWQLNSANEYENNWPPLNQQMADNELPRMIKLVIEMENGDQIERIVPGVEMPVATGRGGTGGGGSGDRNSDGENSDEGNSGGVDQDGNPIEEDS